MLRSFLQSGTSDCTDARNAAALAKLMLRVRTQEERTGEAFLALCIRINWEKLKIIDRLVVIIAQIC
jgi:hypothetical protein